MDIHNHNGTPGGGVRINPSDLRILIETQHLKTKLITGTTHASAGTQSTHAHGLGVIPTWVIITPTANGVVYKSAASDATNIYLKASANSITFEAIVIL